MIVRLAHCTGCRARAHLWLTAARLVVTEGWRLTAVQRGTGEIEPRVWCPACVASGVPERTRTPSRPITGIGEGG